MPSTRCVTFADIQQSEGGGRHVTYPVLSSVVLLHFRVSFLWNNSSTSLALLFQMFTFQSVTSLTLLSEGVTGFTQSDCRDIGELCGFTVALNCSSSSFLCVISTALCDYLNPLNPELNPMYYLLALLGAQHFLHVSRIRVKLLTFRLLMSYIYIYIYIWSTHSWCF